MVITASRWTYHKKQYTCALASRQVSVLTLCFLMKLDGIVRGVLDGDYSVKILLIVCSLESIQSSQEPFCFTLTFISGACKSIIFKNSDFQ